MLDRKEATLGLLTKSGLAALLRHPRRADDEQEPRPHPIGSDSAEHDYECSHEHNDDSQEASGKPPRKIADMAFAHRLTGLPS